MRIQATIATARAAVLLAAPAGADELRETVARKFNHAIPNIPGKPRAVVAVDFPHCHRIDMCSVIPSSPWSAH